MTVEELKELAADLQRSMSDIEYNSQTAQEYAREAERDVNKVYAVVDDIIEGLNDLEVSKETNSAEMLHVREQAYRDGWNAAILVAELQKCDNQGFAEGRISATKQS